jgi:CBS domain-containing protein
VNVREAMSSPVVTVGPRASLKEVAGILAERRISGVPVIDADGQLLGVVSEADFVTREGGGAAPAPSPFLWFVHQPDEREAALHRLSATTAGDAMSSPVVTIAPDDPLRAAAALMRRHAVNRLPVVEGGTLVGILTRADLLKAYLRSDAELVTIAREEILRRTLWIEPDELMVESSGGRVTVAGRVDRRSTAEMVERLIREIDGVIGVEVDLTWELDDRRVEAAPLPPRGVPEERNWT